MRSSSGTRLPTIHNPDPPTRTRTFVGPFVILVGIVFASAIQTEVASHLAQQLEFKKPYFSFFVTHVAFSFVFPIHLAVLSLARGPRGAPARARQLLRTLRAVLAEQLGTQPRWRQLARPLTNKIVPLTMLISFPAISWYVAMALSPAMDVTAIYATSAFHTYFFSLLLLGTRLTKVTVAAIAVAFAGVIVITLDDAGKEGSGGNTSDSSRKRVMGDIIMMLGAAGLGLYEVVYKMVLPESEGGAHKQNASQPNIPGAGRLSPSLAPHEGSVSPSLAPQEESATEPEDDDDDDNRIAMGRAGSRTPLLSKHTRNGSAASDWATGSPGGPSTQTLTRPPFSRTPSGSHPPPQLPAAFHSNFLTSALGFGTLVLLWIPFPFIHWTDIETFVWPRGRVIWSTLAVVASMGATYNAGLMTLIGIWGPTVASVANLLTIALVGIADALWMGSVPSLVKIGGAGLICAGFGVLLWEGDEA